jgi:hypothetical protein
MSINFLYATMKCPRCGSEGEVEIEAAVDGRGRPPLGDMQADGYAVCPACKKNYFVIVSVERDVIRSVTVDSSRRWYIADVGGSLANSLIERFFATGDVEFVVQAIQQREAACTHSYPVCHRIRDVRLDEGGIRICRCVACDRAFVVAIEHASDEAGVPWQLRGERLHEWVIDEAEHPSRGPIDWADWL